MTMFAFFVALAVAMGLQLWLTSRQSRAFMLQVTAMRRSGRVAVGVGGRRWLGRKAYVALAFDARDRVVEAIVLRGLTQFAQARPAQYLIGVPLRTLSGDRAVAGCDAIERAAVRQAAQALSAAGGLQPTSGATEGKEAAQPQRESRPVSR
jgi:DNA-binding transcriptional regulator of glucitol operon